jgi:DNA-binding NtrC family response regulator
VSIIPETEPHPSTSSQALNICVLDDDRESGKKLEAQVQQLGFCAFRACDPSDALEQIASGRCRIILCDFNSKEADGLDFVQHALHLDPGVFVVLIANFHSVESAIQAIRGGAYDYLTKPIDETRLRKTLSDLAEQFQRRRRIQKLEQQLLSDLEFRKEIRRLTHRAKALMTQYGWPGNVRELESVIAGAALLATSDFIDLDDLPDRVQRPSGDRGADAAWRPLPLEDVRNRHIRKVLEACGGNRVRAAQLLGIGRTSLYRYLKRENQSGAHNA